MARKAKKEQADSIINIRVTKTTKAKIKAMADDKNITMTELLIGNIGLFKLRDRAYENQIFQSINNLTKEFSYIGKNINQVTIAIHQINNGHKVEEGEFREFINISQKYLSKRDELIDLLLKVKFCET